MRRVRVEVFDDLDWNRDRSLTEAEGTILVGLDGKWARLDVSGKSREMIEGALGEWMRAGHDPGEEGSPSALRPRRTIPRTSLDYGKALRKFAREKGLSYTTESGKYYYSAELREAYAAHLARQGNGS